MTTIDHEQLLLRRTFYEEAEDRLNEVERLLLELEQAPHELELLDGVFRAVHSVKGASAACELNEFATFAHMFESLLAPLRKGQLAVSGRLLDVFLQSTDVLRTIMDASKLGREDGSRRGHTESIIARIRAELACVSVDGESAPTSAPATDLSAGFVLWEDDTVAVQVASPHQEHGDEAGDAAHGQPDAPRAGETALPTWTQSVRALALPTPSPVRTATDAGRDPHIVQSGLGAVVDEVAAEQLARGAEEVELDDDSFAQLLRLTERLAACSAQLSQAVTASGELGGVRLMELLSELAEPVTELEVRLTTARGAGHTSHTFEGVVVRCGDTLYALPAGPIEAYLTPDPAAFREHPGHGRVLMGERQLLPVVPLASLIGDARETGEAEPAIAVIGRFGESAIALLVDEVIAQGRLLLKAIETNFRKIEGIAGAVLWGSQLALALDVGALLAARRRAAFTRSRPGMSGSASARR